MTDLAGFCRKLAEQAPDGPLLLALSGGLDSSLLLHLLVRAGLGPRLSVVHVDHQLQSHSQDWSRFCESLAQRHGLPFTLERVAVDPSDGLEAGARNARYAALLPLARSRDATLITGHHRSDQAETLLLRLLRGAGVQGLSAMRALTARDGVSIWRPLLELDRQCLAQWAQSEHLCWQDDPSNNDESLRRNYLRHRIMPAFRERWPGADATLARAADHMAEASGLLEEIAEADAAEAGVIGARLPLNALSALSLARQRNLLRWWLQNNGATTPSQAVLEELLAVQEAAEDSQARVEWGNWAARLYRGALYLAPRGGFAPWQGDRAWPEGEEPPAIDNWSWSRQACPGAIPVTRPPGDLVLRGLTGTAKMQRNGMHQQVKERWRAAGVPPWQRRQWPLLYRGGRLVAAPLLGPADGEVLADCETWFLYPRPDGQ